MNAIRIRRTLDSETLHLPELKPLLGHTVEIIVLDETPAERPDLAAYVRPGTGDWAAAERAAKALRESGFDFDFLDYFRGIDQRHADDHMP